MRLVDIVLKADQVFVLRKRAQQKHVTICISPKTRLDHSVAIPIGTERYTSQLAFGKKVRHGHDLACIKQLYAFRNVGRGSKAVKPCFVPVMHETPHASGVNSSELWAVPKEIDGAIGAKFPHSPQLTDRSSAGPRQRQMSARLI
jgi:hypothetical protein